MRHVPQESTSLVSQIQQALAQPFELAAQPLEIVRTGDGNLARKGPLAQLADRPVELPQRSADHERQGRNRDDRQRHQQGGLPEQPPASDGGLLVEGRDLGVDLVVGLRDDLVGQGRQFGEIP